MRISDWSSDVCSSDLYLDHPDLSKRDLIIMIGIGDLDFSRVVLEYERRGVIVYERVASSIYSKRMLDSFKLKGGIRVSPLHVHTPEDVEDRKSTRLNSSH